MLDGFSMGLHPLRAYPGSSGFFFGFSLELDRDPLALMKRGSVKLAVNISRMDGYGRATYQPASARAVSLGAKRACMLFST